MAGVDFKKKFLGCIIGRRGITHTASFLRPCQKNYLKPYKNGKRLFIVFIFFISSVLFFPAHVQSTPKMISECGMAQVIEGNIGRAKTQALQDAQRNAVENGIGTLIASQTIVKNARLIKDSIYSQASGYVTNYRIVSEGLTPSGSTYELCMEGTVDIADIEKDLRAIGILKRQIGNPRFVAVYLHGTNGQVGDDDDALVVKSAQNAINEVFLKKGFLVLDRIFINGFVKELKQRGDDHPDLNSLSLLALKYQADLLLLFDVDASERTDLANQYFKEIRLSLDIRSVAPATADIVSSEGKSTRVRTSKKMADDLYESPLIANAMTKLAKQVSDALLGETLAYFERQSHEGTRLRCWFRDFEQDEIFTIVDVIENMTGYRDKNVRSQFSDAVELDVSYTGKRFDFQRELLSGLRKKGVKIEIREAKGNDFLIYKDRRE